MKRTRWVRRIAIIAARTAPISSGAINQLKICMPGSVAGRARKRIARFLEADGNIQQQLLLPRPGDQLNSDRKPKFRETERNGDARKPEQVERGGGHHPFE